MQMNRTGTGGLVDRSRAISFSFDGKRYRGHPGDTLASALLANGVVLTGRSFKYHRPRGIVSAGSEEPNALVELRKGAYREPNTRATMVELFEGLEANSQNRWPSLQYDLLSVNSLLSSVFVAGFYYKTFMWPAALWEKLYEPAIRRAAGLGRAADEADPDHYEKVTAHCDVLIVGGGPAGIAAAVAASQSNARVILVDEGAALGGRAIDDAATIDDTHAIKWVAAMEEHLKHAPNVKVLKRTTVFGSYDDQTFGAVERVADHLPRADAKMPRQRLWRIVARRSLVAAGATERPLVFGGNDRPGVMLAGAVRTYINRYGVAPGRKAVVFTNNDDALKTVNDLAGSGVKVVAIVDSRRTKSAVATRAAEAVGATLFSAAVVRNTIGSKRVRGVEIDTAGGQTMSVDCDLLAVSGGWNPNVQLTSHLGDRPGWDDRIQAFVPRTLPANMTVAGAANGQFSLKACLNAGAKAGKDLVRQCGFETNSTLEFRAADEPYVIEPLWQVTAYKGKAFVDQQNDVTASDIALAEREGFRSVEHLKRYTTLGMATDQGRTSNVNGLAIMAELTKRTVPQTGVTLARPPYTPVAIGAFAGHHRGKEFKATRLPPSYKWSRENGASFVDTGLWKRAAYYPRPGENDWLDTVTREVNTVRSAVGICDMSTLGKVDIQGRDAAEFLDRIYMNDMKSIPVGKAGYGGMLREDGMFMDDGTISRLGETHYFVTTTTVNAVKVFQHMELCAQWLWPELDVQLVSATEQWAQYAVAGPKSRELLRKIVDSDFDISDASFPFLQVGRVAVCGGIKARLYRLSLSGERAFEIAVPSRFGDALMRKLMDAGREFGVCAYGSEALGVMRIEKGHISGPEINGTTTPRDLGLDFMMSPTKDFVGSVLGKRPGLLDPNRPTLVGLRPVKFQARLRAGAHLLARDADVSPQADEGHLTSAAFSPTLGHWIALGLLRGGQARIGETVRAYDPVRGGDELVEVVSPHFVDPEGRKLHG